MTTISANNEIRHGILALDDDDNHNRLDAVKDDYVLVDFIPGKAIKFDLFSEEFDTYLQLINSDTGAIISENDDFNSTSNSQLSFITEEHINYLVRVTSYGSPETGNYTLSSDNEIDIDLVIEDAEVTIVAYDELYNNLELSDTAYDPYYNEAYINLDLSLTVKNWGTETAFADVNDDNYYDYYFYPYNNGWSDTVYLSSDEHFDPLEDSFVTEIWHDENLEGGKSYRKKFEANLYKPDVWGRENNYLIFVTDSNNDQYEADEHNNTFAIPLDLNLTPPDVDLIITDAHITSTPYHNYYGETYLDFSLTITNQGSETAFGLGGYDYYYGSDLYSTVYISSDEHFDPLEDFWLADFWHDSNLGAGQSHTAYTTGYFYDYDLQQTGDQYLIFVADSYNYQHETDEHNNIFTIPLDLNLTPPDVDLIVTDAHVTSTSYHNDYGETYLDFSLTITNQGSETAFGLGGYDYYYESDLYSAVYISSDEHFDPLEDFWLADFWHDSNLGAGQSHTAYTTGYLYDYDLQQTGDQYLIFVADSYNYQHETDEHNNIFTIPLDIALNPSYSDHVLATPIYRYQNQNVPGTYLFLGEEERSEIHTNFTNFVEEGLAFKVGSEPQDDLIAMYRFQSITVPGTYLYVGEEERISINQNYSDSFIEEGLSFYVYGAGEGKGTTFYRFRNTNPNLDSTYLFATGEEAENIRHNFPNFIEEGAAFEALI